MSMTFSDSAALSINFVLTKLAVQFANTKFCIGKSIDSSHIKGLAGTY